MQWFDSMGIGIFKIKYINFFIFISTEYFKNISYSSFLIFYEFFF